MMIDRVVGDWSWSWEGLPGKCSLLNLFCKFIYDSFKLTEHLKRRNDDIWKMLLSQGPSTSVLVCIFTFAVSEWKTSSAANRVCMFVTKNRILES